MSRKKRKKYRGIEDEFFFKVVFDEDVFAVVSEYGVSKEEYQEVIREQIINVVYQLLDTLFEREALCIKENYFNGLTLRELCKFTGVTQERNRQIIAKGIRKLRHPKRSNQVLDIIPGYWTITDIRNYDDNYRYELEERQRYIEREQEIANIEAQREVPLKIFFGKCGCMHHLGLQFFTHLDEFEAVCKECSEVFTLYTEEKYIKEKSNEFSF